MAWSKFKSLFKCTVSGHYDRKSEDCSSHDLNVNEEYMAAHRTDSYIEILDKVEAQLRRKSLERLSLTSPASPSLHMRLSENVLEPCQETLASMIEDSNLHPLVITYFQSSFEACNTCALLLRSAHQVRNNYKIIQSVIMLTNGIHDSRSYGNAQFRGILDDLASFSTLNNPLMTIKPAQFQDIRSTHGYLLRNLMTKLRKTQRKAKLKKYCKKIARYTLVSTSTALLVALLIVDIHTMVGIFAAPGVISCSFGLLRKNKLKSRELKMSLNEQLEAELEVAAKGVFIMVNEFDTMSLLVKRLQNEIEHIKAIADMCVKNEKSEVLVEVVKEFQAHQKCFLDQLEELQEHIYLCFLTINRSRMLVIEEIMTLKED